MRFGKETVRRRTRETIKSQALVLTSCVSYEGVYWTWTGDVRGLDCRTNGRVQVRSALEQAGSIR